MSTKFEYLGNAYYCLTDKENKITFDPLLLSDFAEVRENILDLCSGNGIIALLMHKKGCKNITAIEINENAVNLAKSGAEKSNANIDFICGDVRDIESLISQKFDAVTVNPPYFKGKLSDNTRRNEMRNESALSLEEVISASSFALKKSGILYMCQRPERKYEISDVLRRYSMSLSEIVEVSDNSEKKPFLILIKAVKGQAELVNLKRINLKADGEYTQYAKNIFFPERND